MGERKDGGPAFPPNSSAEGERGMSLRDWFAGQALTGLMSRRDWAVSARIETYASEAYKMADAMLTERSKP